MRTQRIGLVLLLALLALQAQSVYVGPTAAGAAYTSITSTTLTVVKAGPGIFLGVYAPGAQVNAMECWDNASAASGTIIYNKLAPQALNDTPPLGMAVYNGITCQQTVSVAGNVMVLWK